MKVEEILDQKNSLFGSEVTVEGILVEQAPEYHFYLAPDKHSKENLSKCILVIPPFSSDELENRLPGMLVGSRY